MKIVLLVLSVSFIGWSSLCAQQVVASGGGTAENDNMSLSYTVGEIATETFVSGDHMLSQGMQQGIVIAKITSVESSEIEVTVFPNPTSNGVFLESSNSKNLKYKLLTVGGSVLQEGRLDEKCLIDLSEYASGSYIVAFGENDEVQYSIVKN